MTAVEEFQVSTATLAATTQQEVLTVYAAYTAGQISMEDAMLIIGGIINRATAAAVTLGDLWLTAQIEELTGVATRSVGVLPTDDSERLITAVHTVLTEQADAEMRLSRLARSESLEAAQNGIHEAMQSQQLVEGWTRQMDADPCQLCTWWWREGRIWPKEHPFQRHKGCNCQPRIVLAEDIKSTGYTRQLRRSAA
ncbi:hypothetical protein [Mycobacterium sp. GA-2829]|uniref:hypothetical protein n=1 Tax=Mycobacterium sp. GA-2829 TaxID=1772283 RepID=UPI00073FDEC8|nr:hypothetical protein [Mycobacterium sp. GA-2829]KUI27753.1 hypothetical protein AU194_21905 [Mycobacterium sp. GA-2829]